MLGVNDVSQGLRPATLPDPTAFLARPDGRRSGRRLLFQEVELGSSHPPADPSLLELPSQRF